MLTPCEASRCDLATGGTVMKYCSDQWTRSLLMAGSKPGWRRIGHSLRSHRDKKAAKHFFRKLLATLRYVPRVIVTDKSRGSKGLLMILYLVAVYIGSTIAGAVFIRYWLLRVSLLAI